MPRKTNKNNPLQVRMRARSLPKGTTPKKYLQRLIQHITEGRPLPESWDVEIGWRNPETKIGRTRKWRYDGFEDAISDSREGFVSLIQDVLVRRLRRIV